MIEKTIKRGNRVYYTLGPIEWSTTGRAALVVCLFGKVIYRGKRRHRFS